MNSDIRNHESRRPAHSSARRNWGIAGAAVLGLVAVGLIGTQAVRLTDQRHAEAAWAELAGRAQVNPPAFSPDMVADLPEPARRYFLFTIAPGTPLRTVAEFEMAGRIGLGDKQDPGYMPMRVREILAPPHGFVWMPEIGDWPMRVTGSDGHLGDDAWTRFWLAGVVPVARAGGTPDYVRSAAARTVIESFWVPATLLPHNGAVWEAVGANRARVSLEVNGERIGFTLTVADDGRPLSVVMDRWSNANPEGIFRYQPFGGDLEVVGTYGGFTVPTRVRVGNLYGTDAYFPFFEAEITAMRFL